MKFQEKLKVAQDGIWGKQLNQMAYGTGWTEFKNKLNQVYRPIKNTVKNFGNYLFQDVVAAGRKISKDLKNRKKKTS